MGREIVVRRARQRDIETIVGIMNSSGWLAQPMTEADAAGTLLEKGYLLAVSRTGAALVGWQTENLVTCADDFFVYPPHATERLGTPLLERLEASARELECEVAVILIPEKGRSALESMLSNYGYENNRVTELDRIWIEVLTPLLAEGQDHVWLKRLKKDRVTMPF